MSIEDCLFSSGMSLDGAVFFLLRETKTFPKIRLSSYRSSYQRNTLLMKFHNLSFYQFVTYAFSTIYCSHLSCEINEHSVQQIEKLLKVS